MFRLVKTDTKDKLETLQDFTDAAKRLHKAVAKLEPEPEESQPMTTDWIDLIAIAAQVEQKGFVKTQELLSKHFVIQRKKQ